MSYTKLFIVQFYDGMSASSKFCKLAFLIVFSGRAPVDNNDSTIMKRESDL